MADGGGSALEVLLGEAWDAYGDGRYRHALAAANRAVAAAELLGGCASVIVALQDDQRP